MRSSGRDSRYIDSTHNLTVLEGWLGEGKPRTKSDLMGTTRAIGKRLIKADQPLRDGLLGKGS